MVAFRSFKVVEFGRENRWAVTRPEPEGLRVIVGPYYTSRMAAEREVLKLNEQAGSRIMGEPRT